MTDKPGNAQRGLSIFDDPAEPAPSQSRPHDTTQLMPSVSDSGTQGHQGYRSMPRPELPVVRRGGYDKGAVDHYLGQFLAGQADADQRARSAQEQNRSLSARVAELEKQLAEQATPTYSGL